MKVFLFYYSVVSDWNHSNAHILRDGATDERILNDHTYYHRVHELEKALYEIPKFKGVDI